MKVLDMELKGESRSHVMMTTQSFSLFVTSQYDTKLSNKEKSPDVHVLFVCKAIFMGSHTNA